MMVNSPLGQYAPLVATITSMLVIGAYVLALLFGTRLGVDTNAINQLQSIALLAIGAVFGSAVSVNGWKQPLVAAHTRLDTLEKEVAVTSAAVGVNTTDIADNAANTAVNTAGIASNAAGNAANTANIAQKGN